MNHVLTADISLRVDCGNIIRDRSKGQPNQQRYTREWRKVAQEGGSWANLDYTYKKY